VVSIALADEINDLFDDSPLEDALWHKLKMMDQLYGRRTLHAAAYAGDLEAVRQYVAEGDDLESLDQGWDSKNRTVLGVAAHEGHAEMVQFLLAHGANPNVLGGNAEPPLLDALWSGNIEVVRCLLDHGVDVNATDANGNHALITLAAMYGDRQEPEWGDLTRLFIAAGCDVNHVNEHGMTALKAAVFKKPYNEANLEVARILLEAGAAINATAGEDGWTALMAAVSQGNLGAARLLVEIGANVNQTDLNGDTAWNLALRWGHTEIADLLEQAGAVEPADVVTDLH
jgi:ankyrin repeat protein